MTAATRATVWTPVASAGSANSAVSSSVSSCVAFAPRMIAILNIPTPSMLIR